MTQFSIFSAYNAVRALVEVVPEGSKSMIHEEREARVSDIDEVVWEREVVVIYVLTRLVMEWVVDGVECGGVDEVTCMTSSFGVDTLDVTGLGVFDDLLFFAKENLGFEVIDVP